MKRLAVSTLAALCAFVLTSTAEASFVEKSFVDDPEWKTQEEVESDAETRVDARTAVPADAVEQREQIRDEEENDFNETDSGEIEFGEDIELTPIDFSSSTMTRAEFTAMLVRSRYGKASIDWCYWDITSVWPPKFELLFRDVPVDHEFAPEICVALRDGLVRGYGNDVFRPDAPMTFADAAKLVARVEGLTPYADSAKPKHWFDPYVEALAARNAIPLSVEKLEERLTGAEAKEILDRLANGETDKPSRTAAQLISAWERAYEAPRPRPVAPRPAVPVRPKPMGPANSSAASSVRSVQASSAASVRSSAAAVSSHAATSAAASSATSRPKAWYEF